MRPLPAALALILLAGCGGGSGKADADPEPTAAPLSSAATCIRATDDAQLSTLLDYLVAAFGEGSPTAAQTKKADAALDSLEALEPRAALDIRPDLHALTTGTRKIMAVYAKGAGDIESTDLKAAAGNLTTTCDVAAGSFN